MLLAWPVIIVIVLVTVNMLTFIGQYYLDDVAVCDGLIDYHQSSPNKAPGKIGYKGAWQVDAEVKASTDVEIQETDAFNDARILDYMQQFKPVIERYKQEYQWCHAWTPWAIEAVNIQHYAPGQGFYKWHTERSSKREPDSARTLVWMTYLNDVDQGGETEFYYQELKVKPRKGLTLMWPADWTHTHRGIPAPAEEKYIVTGWFSYIH